MKKFLILFVAIWMALSAKGAGVTVSTANGVASNLTVIGTTTSTGPWSGAYSPLLIQTNTMFISTNGNDATAVLGNPNMPWRHGIVALNGSQSGYTLQFGPGGFTNGETITQAQSLMTNWGNVTIKGAGRDETVWSPLFTATATGKQYVLTLSGTNFISDIDIRSPIPTSANFNIPFVVAQKSYDVVNNCRFESTTNAVFSLNGVIYVGNDNNGTSLSSTNTLIVSDTEFIVGGPEAVGLVFDNTDQQAYSTNIFHRCSFFLAGGGASSVAGNLNSSPANSPVIICDSCYSKQIGTGAFIEEGNTNFIAINTTFVTDNSASTAGPIGTPNVSFSGQFSRYINCNQIYYNNGANLPATNFMGGVVVGNGSGLSNLNSSFPTQVNAAGLVVTNGETNLTLTASTVLEASANKKVVSLANGTGALTNNGSGNVGWASFSPPVFQNVSPLLDNSGDPSSYNTWSFPATYTNTRGVPVELQIYAFAFSDNGANTGFVFYYDANSADTQIFPYTNPADNPINTPFAVMVPPGHSVTFDQLYGYAGTASIGYIDEIH